MNGPRWNCPYCRPGSVERSAVTTEDTRECSFCDRRIPMPHKSDEGRPICLSGPYACENGHFHQDKYAADMCDDLARMVRAGLPARDDGGPIPLNDRQIQAVQDWSSNYDLWGSKSAVEFNLYTFARVILKFANDETGGR